MKKTNSVFIATSLDGYIADKDGKIDWLHSIPNPDNNDMGYTEFTSQIDALIMGRTTFETVCGFDIDWPYTKPVYVLSNTLTEIPSELGGNVHLIKGPLTEVLAQIHNNGHNILYIDGGTTIQGFLKEDLIDNIVITVIPVLLGGGTPLFSELVQPINFECIKSKLFLNKNVQNHFKRTK